MWKRATLTVLVAAILLGRQHIKVAVLGEFTAEWPVSSLLHLANYFTMSVMPYQVRLLEHVMRHSTKGNASSVVAEIDRFAWDWPTMNVGPVKVRDYSTPPPLH